MKKTPSSALLVLFFVLAVATSKRTPKHATLEPTAPTAGAMER